MRFEIELYGNSPITVGEAQQYLKIATDDDNATLATMIASVVKFAEDMTRRELRNNKWHGFVDSFYDDLEIQKTVVQDITKIEYITGGVVTVLDPATYWLSRDVLSSYIVLADGASWPEVDNTTDAIRIFFTTSPDMMLPAIKVQMLKHLAHMYENRGDEPVDASYNLGNVDYYKSVSIPNF